MSKRLKIKSVREGGAAVLLVGLVLLPMTLMVLVPAKDPAKAPSAPEEAQAAPAQPRPSFPPRPHVVVPLANHEKPTSFWRNPDPKRIAATQREVATARRLSNQDLLKHAKLGDHRRKLVAINTLWVRGKRLEAVALAKGDPKLEAKITVLRQANK